jgi:hypothetical protein
VVWRRAKKAVGGRSKNENDSGVVVAETDGANDSAALGTLQARLKAYWPCGDPIARSTAKDLSNFPLSLSLFAGQPYQMLLMRL